MECTRTWDRAGSPVSLGQHLLAPMGLLVHDHTLLWGRKPIEQQQSDKAVKQRATGMIKHTFFRSPCTIQISGILLKSVGPGTNVSHSTLLEELLEISLELFSWETD